MEPLTLSFIRDEVFQSSGKKELPAAPLRRRLQWFASTLEDRGSRRSRLVADAAARRTASSRTALRTYRWLTVFGATTKRNACEPSFVATIWRSPLATEIERELGPPRASTMVSTEASIVAAITLTTSNRIPSRVQEARTDPVRRRNSTASRPPSVSIADKKERDAFSSADNDLRPRPIPPLPKEDGPIGLTPQKGSPASPRCGRNVDRRDLAVRIPLFFV